MNLHDYAQQLLFGETIADKLFQPQKLVACSTKPRLLKFPSYPNRPDKLSLQTRSQRWQFPSPKKMEEDKQRGYALHFFANHELLAIELMALCILRFPDTPFHFRRGLAHIIQEEQQHLRLYINRSKELGVELGEIPVNAFFWNSLKDMTCPLEFIAGMSLTFEQANLDHSIYFQHLFKQIGDTKSADIMTQVYQDEIRHVRHGVRWLREWKEDGESDFSTQSKHLRKPLTMMRAKGKIFDKKGRKEAGLKDEYIQSLQVFAYSTGRSPNIYKFNGNCELEMASAAITPNKRALALDKDLDCIPLFFAQKGDVVLVQSKPENDYLLHLERLGFSIPQLVHNTRELNTRKIGKFIPWGQSPKIAKSYEPFGATWNPIWRELFSKGFGANLLSLWTERYGDRWGADKNVYGITCSTEQEVFDQVKKYKRNGYSNVLIKAQWCTAGRDRIEYRNEWPPNASQWIRKTLKKQGSVVVEPKLQKVIDFSIQFTITKTGKHKVDGYNRFATNGRGQYIGHYLGTFNVPQQIHRFFQQTGSPRGIKRLVESAVEVVGSELFKRQYIGPVGIDAMLYKNNGALKIRPIVEVNPRYTMGRLALQIQKNIHKRGVMLITSAQKGRQLMKKYPLQRQGNILQHGFTNITPCNRDVGIFIGIGEDLQQCLNG